MITENILEIYIYTMEPAAHHKVFFTSSKKYNWIRNESRARDSIAYNIFNTYPN